MAITGSAFAQAVRPAWGPASRSARLAIRRTGLVKFLDGIAPEGPNPPPYWGDLAAWLDYREERASKLSSTKPMPSLRG